MLVLLYTKETLSSADRTKGKTLEMIAAEFGDEIVITELPKDDKGYEERVENSAA